MGNYNFNSISYNPNIYKTSFKGENNNLASTPINTDNKIGSSHEFASKEYANASRSIAMAQILENNGVRPNMTYMDYVDKLIKKGKNPEKDFKVTTNADSFLVEEFNSKGQVIKETVFADEKHNNDIIVRMRNPNNNVVYKVFEYTSDGNIFVGYHNPKTGGPLIGESYNNDGSLQNYAMYRKRKVGESSVDGKYVITDVK